MTMRYRKLCKLLCAALCVLYAAPLALACIGADGTIPPFGGSKPNGTMAGLISSAWKSATAKGLNAPPSPPISGTQPTVIILIQNVAGGATFAYPTATLWSQRLTDIASYYTEVSNGAFTISPAAETFGTANDGVIGPVSVSGLSSTSDIQGGNSMALAVAAIQAANPYINFAAFDTNANGTIEANELHILIYQAGNETSFGGAPALPRAWAHMQWQTPALAGLTPASDSDGKNIMSYCYCGSEFNNSQMATMGQMTHELGHDIGLPDCYDADGTGSGGDWAGLGYFSLMAAGSWGTSGGQQGTTPVHIDGFNKAVLGWSSLTTVTAPANQYVTLATANGSNQALRINVTGSNDFFLVENRQQTGYDAGLPGSLGGLLVFHGDASILTDTNIRISNQINQNPTNYGIKVVEADNNNALLSSSNGGADTDFYRSGNNVLLNGSSSPNSNLKSGAASNVSLSGIGASSASMTFLVGSTPVPAAQFSSATYSVNENGVTATITVNLDQAPGTGNTVSVQYATSNGTATAGQDYTAASGTLSFSNAEVSKTFQVTIANDHTHEANETVTLTLSSPTSCTITGTNPATLTIIDDDIDTDGDSISDWDELAGTLGYITNPNLFDTDGDHVNDWVEIQHGTDPTNPLDFPLLRSLGVPFFK